MFGSPVISICALLGANQILWKWDLEACVKRMDSGTERAGRWRPSQTTEFLFSNRIGATETGSYPCSIFAVHYDQVDNSQSDIGMG